MVRKKKTGELAALLGRSADHVCKRERGLLEAEGIDGLALEGLLARARDGLVR